jgi:anti-sigma regulatory factor (Ser/Thr protein kinase)
VGLHIAPILPHALESVSDARGWLDGVFAAEKIDGDGCDVCRLLLEEVVSNAVIHGGSDAEVSVEVTDIVRAEVTNRGTHGVVEPIPYERGEPASHFGLHLVHGLATTWGVTRDDETTTVWFELPRPGRAEPGARPHTLHSVSGGDQSRPSSRHSP